MLRKFLCAGFVLVACVGLGLTDEIRAVITKVDNGKITFYERKGKNEKGDEKTMPVADSVKVSKGKYNQETKKIEAGEALADGLKSEPFTNIGEKGVPALLVTEGDKITEIRLGGRRKKE